MHATSTYDHSWYLVFEFTSNATYFHRVSDIYCMRLYLVYQTLNSYLVKWVFPCGLVHNVGQSTHNGASRVCRMHMHTLRNTLSYQFPYIVMNRCLYLSVFDVVSIWCIWVTNWYCHVTMERIYYSMYTIRRYGRRFPERPNPRPLAPSLRVLPLHAYGIGCSPLALKSIISSLLHRLHPLPMHSGSLLRKPLRILIFSALFSEFF